MKFYPSFATALRAADKAGLTAHAVRSRYNPKTGRSGYVVEA